MKFLLDTHILLWWMQSPQRLSPTVAELLSADDADIFISAATAWELAIKVRSGKLEFCANLLENFTESVAELGATPLPITLAHGIRAGLLVGEHRDPFDRMLAAQSSIENLPLVTVDPAFSQFGVQTVW